jgi:hypothetical protein
MEIARKGLIALAVLVSTAIASIPAAADGGNGAYPDQPYYPSIWQGLYAGVHVGFGNGDGGVLGGGQLGYNWQSGRIVYGAPREDASEAGGRMSSALNLEMRDVEKAIMAANAAVTRGEWTEAERALAEVQDRVGRLLREVALKQAQFR